MKHWDIELTGLLYLKQLDRFLVFIPKQYGLPGELSTYIDSTGLIFITNELECWCKPEGKNTAFHNCSHWADKLKDTRINDCL